MRTAPLLTCRLTNRGVPAGNPNGDTIMSAPVVDSNTLDVIDPLTLGSRDDDLVSDVSMIITSYQFSAI